MNGKFASVAELDQPEVMSPSQFNGSGPHVGAFGQIIGQSKAWRQITKQIEIVAPTDATVPISGDTGTGKELIAHELHQRSLRKHQPLIRVNCACIPKELYESEFFGHAKGCLPVRLETEPAVLRRRRAERYFWMRSVKSHWNCRANFCGFYRRKLRTRGRGEDPPRGCTNHCGD